MRAAAIICFVLAGFMAVNCLQMAMNPPAGPHDDAFWMGHYIGLIFAPLIPLSLGLGLRRIAKRREQRKRDSDDSTKP